MNKDRKFAAVTHPAMAATAGLFYPRTVLVVLACVLMVPACATAPQASPTAKEAAAMPVPESAAPADNPKLSAEEIGARFLKLIAGLKTRSDLNLNRVHEVMGIKFSTVPGDAHHYVSEAPLASNWNYVVGYIDETPSIGKAVYLDFRSSNARFADMTQVCGNDFEHYHTALKRMGFRAVEIRGEIGQLESWRYYKDDITLSIIPQNMVPGEAGRLCVKSISTLN